MMKQVRLRSYSSQIQVQKNINRHDYTQWIWPAMKTGGDPACMAFRCMVYENENEKERIAMGGLDKGIR